MKFVMKRAGYVDWLFAALWLPLWVTVLYRLTPVHVDNFQNAGSIAGATGFGQLAWPMMDGFHGHGDYWGFHWFGPGVLRSFTTFLIPWHPLTELILIGIGWGLCAVLAGHWARKCGVRPWLSHCVVVTILINSTTMIGAGFYRPEWLVALLLLVMLPGVLMDRGSRYYNYVVAFGLVMLPNLHPIGFILAPALGAGLALLAWRESGFQRFCIVAASSAVCFLAGVGIFVAYYALVPFAWDQLSANLAAQRMLPLEWLNIFIRGFGSSRGKMELPLLGTGVLCAALVAIYFARARFSDSSLIVGALCTLATCFYVIAAKVLNPCHVTAAIPIVIVLAGFGIEQALRLASTRRFGWAVVGYAAVIFCASGVFFVYRVKTLPESWPQSLRKFQAGVVEQLPTARVTYIPVALWEAAYLQNDHGQYRFSTFPNLCLRDIRLEYEKHAYRDLTAGDVLVLDDNDQQAGVFAQVEEIRMRLTDPVVLNEEDWEEIARYEYSMKSTDAMKRRFIVLRRR